MEPYPLFACGGLWAAVSCLATYVHGKKGGGLKADTGNCLVEKKIKISVTFCIIIQIMFCGIHFLLL